MVFSALTVFSQDFQVFIFGVVVIGHLLREIHYGEELQGENFLQSAINGIGRGIIPLSVFAIAFYSLRAATGISQFYPGTKGVVIYAILITAIYYYWRETEE